MELEKTIIQKINQYYSDALYSIQKNDYKEAVDILYKRMPNSLYDASLDILYNRNIKPLNSEFKEVKELIRIVDDKLVEYSTKSESSNLEDNDKFIGDIF